VPRCQPTVEVSIFKGDKEMAALGAFCESEGPVALTVKGKGFSFVPVDHDALNSALASPVDR
jgi:hypothetical protein